MGVIDGTESTRQPRSPPGKKKKRRERVVVESKKWDVWGHEQSRQQCGPRNRSSWLRLALFHEGEAPDQSGRWILRTRQSQRLSLTKKIKIKPLSSCGPYISPSWDPRSPGPTSTCPLQTILFGIYNIIYIYIYLFWKSHWNIISILICPPNCRKIQRISFLWY